MSPVAGVLGPLQGPVVLTPVIVRPRVGLAGVTVLGVVHRVVVVNTRLLLNHLRPGAAAGHGAAEEDVDEQHDPEQYTEGDGETWNTEIERQ